MGRLSLNPTVLLALALMTVIVMMILPVPAFILDMGLALSFGLAILIFTITLFVERPLDFSSFPTVLLASLMLRLSLNISSTKLIIGQGHTGTGAAGGVIEYKFLVIMGIAAIVGGYLGAALAYRIPQNIMRGFIITIGLIMSMVFFLR